MGAVGIIPARWGSSRFPGKPLHPIAGKPLLRHVWEHSCRAQALDSVIIATDDMRIAEAAFNWGAEVSLTSVRHQSGTDRIAEVAAKLGGGVSHIINIQGDEPLVAPGLLNRLVRQMERDPKIELITAVHPFADSSDAQSPHQVKAVLDRQGRALYFSRSPIPYLRDARAAVKYFRHQGIYGYRRDLLLRLVRWAPGPLEKAEALEQLRALENGVNIHVLVTKSGSPGVDTPEDAAAIESKLLRAAGRSRHPSSRGAGLKAARRNRQSRATS